MGSLMTLTHPCHGLPFCQVIAFYTFPFSTYGQAWDRQTDRRTNTSMYYVPPYKDGRIISAHASEIKLPLHTFRQMSAIQENIGDISSNCRPTVDQSLQALHRSATPIRLYHALDTQQRRVLIDTDKRLSPTNVVKCEQAESRVTSAE